ncbi:CAF17-like 4Fe-4S cluster assembly/insertion protein YgfZ [Allokutzneria oryzae]|uniref:YgfZ/GcvT domain-containing protein n=1 Tax=Allokutzneria oryzae TaxID=1378989 RepID=A0ABV5ZYJ5_9PSEU
MTLGQPGAIAPPEDSADPGVPWHFGDPLAEQRTAARSAVVVDRSHRGVIAVPGEDRLTWLHSLTSQHMTELGDGTGTELLVLDVQGRVEHHAVVAELDGTVWLDTERERVAPLLDYLTKMVFWSKVEPRDATDELAVLTVLGPTATDVLGAAGVTAPTTPGEVLALPGGGFARRMSAPDSVDLLVPRAELDAWWTRLTDAGARPAGSWTYEALRVESLRPRLGMDTDERTIPHEVAWIGRAVHLEKGCYRGQETVARVHNLGKPPRRMLLLHLDGSQEVLPPPGSPVTAGGKVVGRVGTAVLHHELGPIALALLKRSVPVESELTAGEGEDVVSAAVDPDSVPPDTGEQPGRAALRRLRG